MARGGKIGYKRKTKNKVRLEKKSSDESDEDYKVDENEEFDESEDDVCSSLAEDDFEDNLGKFEEDEEEEWVEKKVKKVGRPRARRFSNEKEKCGRETKKEEEEDDDIEVFYRQQEDEFVDEKPRKKSRVSKTETYEDSCNENPREKDKVSYTEEEEYGEYDDSMTKMTRNLLQLRDGNPTSRKKKMIGGWGCGRRRKSNKNSDSDFVSSGSSDYEYTISEEEREQVREATEICRRLTTNLRSSSSLKMIKEEELLPSKRKRRGKKGKRKVVDIKVEVGKQVCGICLSEEGKRTVRGVLNCCSHYFCFACIMEWSKVESRCPLCKQRFATISRTARADGGHGLKDAVFPVPERDQVLGPNHLLNLHEPLKTVTLFISHPEEELRGYLDPYENVLCTECQQGGDDAFMLLCDLCDSPAHTYCVGLGREVPDGNWYCDGCRPTALASSNTLNPNPDNNASNNLSVGSSPVSVRETFDLNEAYVPDTPLTPTTGHSQSPRHSIGHSQATPPINGSGAFTLFDRRRIQRQIHHLLNNRIRQFDRSDGRLPEVFSPRFSSLRGGALGSQASTSTGHSFGGLSQTEFAGINSRIIGGLGHQQLHPCSGTSNTRADASTSPYQLREATVPSRTFQGPLHTILAVAGGLERHSNGNVVREKRTPFLSMDYAFFAGSELALA
ncbi:hypothetical protein DH2020_003217 [Rehmannia glutinosa]|uniref:Uncharacterized protein n=1 Tax=Rehmannia glutinosa TaxID=99300 RepID=A0ABR0XL06_REHGL